MSKREGFDRARTFLAGKTANIGSVTTIFFREHSFRPIIGHAIEHGFDGIFVGLHKPDLSVNLLGSTAATTTSTHSPTRKTKAWGFARCVIPIAPQIESLFLEIRRQLICAFETRQLDVCQEASKRPEPVSHHMV